MLKSISVPLFCILCIFPGYTKDQQIWPSKVVLLQDCTKNVDGVIKTQMKVIKSFIENILAQEPPSQLIFSCIGESPRDKMEDQNLGLNINSDIIDTLLNEEFRFSKFYRTSEIFILLVDSWTELNGMVPDIVSLKKTIVVQFGQKEQELFTSMASRRDVAFHVQVPKDIPIIEEQLAKELAIMSEYVCDTNKYCTNKGPRNRIITKCQCMECIYICNFKNANVSGACPRECRYHPHFKETQKTGNDDRVDITTETRNNDRVDTTTETGYNDQVDTTPETGNNVVVVISYIVVAVIVGIVIFIALWYCGVLKKVKKLLSNLVGHQHSGSTQTNLGTVAQQTRGVDHIEMVSETSPMIKQDDGTVEIGSGNGETPDGTNDGNGIEETAGGTNDGNGIEETAGGTNDGNGISETNGGTVEAIGDNSYDCDCLIKDPMAFQKNIDAIGCLRVH